VLIVIPTDTPGLVLGDFDFRLYQEAVRQPAPAWTLTETSPAIYSLAGLPNGAPAARYALTWALHGVGQAFGWGGVGTPSAIVIPEREKGLALSDFAAALFKNGAPNSAGLALIELGSSGDYRLSGWPQQSTSAQWAATWTRNGISNAFQWTESPAVEALSDTFGYAELSLDAAELIEEAGQPLRLIQHGGGYNSATMKTEAATSAPYNVSGIQLRDADVPPQYMKPGVRRLSFYLSPRNMPSDLPQGDLQAQTWSLERGGKTFNMMMAEPLAPGGIPLLFMIQVAA
jgi:hypothetical protein